MKTGIIIEGVEIWRQSLAHELYRNRPCVHKITRKTDQMASDAEHICVDCGKRYSAQQVAAGVLREEKVKLLSLRSERRLPFKITKKDVKKVQRPAQISEKKGCVLKSFADL